MKKNSSTVQQPEASHLEPENFSAMKESFQDQTQSSAHGGNEMGWLVSYADMMTLLFGLFVILYSLRSDKTKDADEVMRQVSKTYFSEPEKIKKEESTIPVEVHHKTMIDLESEKAKVVQLQTDVTMVSEQKAQLEKQITELSKKPKASKRIPQSTSTEQVDGLRSQLASAKLEIEALKEKLMNNQKSVQTYLMVILSWETERHDLDLSITTPGKKLFNFKHRKIANERGEFQIDSRFGPGIEMWKAENFQSGHYRIRTSFYNTNGNTVNAKARISVITSAQTYRSGVLDIPITKKALDIDFQVDSKGKIFLK